MLLVEGKGETICSYYFFFSFFICKKKRKKEKRVKSFGSMLSLFAKVEQAQFLNYITCYWHASCQVLSVVLVGFSECLTSLNLVESLIAKSLVISDVINKMEVVTSHLALGPKEFKMSFLTIF